MKPKNVLREDPVVVVVEVAAEAAAVVGAEVVAGAEAHAAGRPFSG
jgi:hypothetical protein